MTEKRFTTDGLWIEDNVRQHSFHVTSENNIYALTDLLNILAEENEQLRHDATILIQSNQDYRKENEQLKQFKEDVFNKIDMHLRMLPTARDNEFDEDDGDPSLYVGAIYMLETLKKELEE